jgi:DNA-binding MarR family transcriptional regulator
MDDEPVPSWSALVAVYQSVLHDVVAALDRQGGMDSGVFSALAYLERADPPHRLPMSELQGLMYPRYSQPGFSRLVQRMQTDGLVERRRDPDDRRAVIVEATPTGTEQFNAANAVYTDALRTAFGHHLNDNDHAQLTAILERVAAARSRNR